MLKQFNVYKEFEIENLKDLIFITVQNDVQPFVFIDQKFHQILFYSKEDDQSLEVERFQIDKNFNFANFFRQELILFKKINEDLYRAFDMEQKIWTQEFYFQFDIEQLFIVDEKCIIFTSLGKVYLLDSEVQKQIINLNSQNVMECIFKLDNDKYIVIQDNQILKLEIELKGLQRIENKIELDYQKLKNCLFFDNRLIMLVINRNNKQEIITYQIDSDKIDRFLLEFDNFQMLENTVFYCDNKHYRECIVLTRPLNYINNDQEDQQIQESYILQSNIQFLVLDIKDLENQFTITQEFPNFEYQNLFLEQIFKNELNNYFLQGHYLIFEEQNQIPIRKYQQNLTNLFDTQEGNDFLNFRSKQNLQMANNFIECFFYEDEFSNKRDLYIQNQTLQDFNENFLSECYKEMLREGHIQFIQMLFNQKNKITKEQVFQEYITFVKFVIEPLLQDNITLLKKNILQLENLRIIKNLKFILIFILQKVKNRAIKDMNKSKISSAIVLDNQVCKELQNILDLIDLSLRQYDIVEFYKKQDQEEQQELQQNWNEKNNFDNSIISAIYFNFQWNNNLNNQNFYEFIFMINDINLLNEIFLFLFMDINLENKDDQEYYQEIKSFGINKKIFDKFSFDLKIENNAISWLLFDFLLQQKFENFSQNDQEEEDMKLKALILLTPDLTPKKILENIRTIQFVELYISSEKLYKRQQNESNDEKLKHLLFYLQNNLYQQAYMYYKQNNIPIHDFCKLIKIENKQEILSKITFDYKEIGNLQKILYEVNDSCQQILQSIKNKQYKQAYEIYQENQNQLRSNNNLTYIINAIQNLKFHQLNYS